MLFDTKHMLTASQIAAIVQCPLPLATRWTDALNAAMQRYNIDTPKRQAAFLAQLAHESAHLSRVSENLNYTPEALMATFNNPHTVRFTPQLANRYGRTKEHAADQKMIANIAYAKRLGNGAVESGDGWLYRGRGPMQITGKNNYRLCSRAIGVDLIANPALLERPDMGAMVAAWYWAEGSSKSASLNDLADRGDIKGISLAINGGTNGLAERIALTNEALAVLT